MVRFLIAFAFFTPLSLLSDESTSDFEKRQILYLMQKAPPRSVIEKYLTYYEKQGKHDYDVLRQMAYHFIEKGINSHDIENQLLALFGISLANDPSFIHYLDIAMQSRHPQVQAAALHLLSNIHEDVAESLICRALKSNFLVIRFEALSLLVARQTKHSLGQVESLMNLLPPQLKPYFTEFFAIHRSPEASSKLKLLVSDMDENVRKTAILYAAKHYHDELIPNIRLALSQSDPSIKETAAIALGILRDSHSMQALRETTKSDFQETKLAALLTLIRLGDTKQLEAIKELARADNTYAILTLSEFPEAKEELQRLLLRASDDIRLNTALALLAHRDPMCIRVITDLLFADPKHVAFIPQISPGAAFVSWKISSPAIASNQDMKRNMMAITMNLQEETLQKCVDLPEESFLRIAESILDSKMKRLVPLVIHLLENRHSEKAIALLQKGSKKVGAPFVRAYCNLGLYRCLSDETAKSRFLNWLSCQSIQQLIEFKPMLDRNARSDKNNSDYQLTPEEQSALYIESFMTIADQHEDAGITLLLKAMRDSHEKNCSPLAGVLLKSIL